MVALGRADTVLEQVIGFIGVRARRGQRGRRLRRHRAHAADVQAERPEEEGIRLMQGLLPDHVATLAIDVSYLLVAVPVHHGPEAHELAGDGAPRHRRGRLRHAGRHADELPLSRTWGNFPLMLAAIAVGGGLAWWSGRIVAMTDMPQMIALYNGMGGGAAAAIAAVELFRMARPIRPPGHAWAGRHVARGGRGLDRRGQLLGLVDRLRQAPGPHQAQLPLQGPAGRQPPDRRSDARARRHRS